MRIRDMSFSQSSSCLWTALRGVWQDVSDSASSRLSAEQEAIDHIYALPSFVATPRYEIPTVNHPTVHKIWWRKACCPRDDLSKWPHDLAKGEGKRLATASYLMKSIVRAHERRELHHCGQAIPVRGQRQGKGEPHCRSWCKAV